MEIPVLKTEINFPSLSSHRKIRSFKESNLPVHIDNGNGSEVIKELLLGEVGEKAYNFLDQNVCLSDSITMLISTSTRFNIEKISLNKYTNIVNLTRVNDIRWLNKFFETINTKLPIEGTSVLVGNNINRIRKEYNDTINLQRSPQRPELWDGNTAKRCLQAIMNFSI